MPPGHWRVAIYERDHPTRRVTAWLGADPPTPSDGGGGWEEVPMPFDAPVLVWRGRSLMKMAVPLVVGQAAYLGPVSASNIDLTPDVPIGPIRARLVNMWRPDDPTAEPPVVKVDTLNDAVPFQTLDYVISGLEWGDAEADEEMNRVMQAFTVTLTEYRPDERVEATHAGSPAKRRQAKHKRRSGQRAKGPKSYTVRTGDTLSGIAAHNHVKGGWQAIAKLQHPPISDPRSIKVGQHLRLP
jgi:nucleoid-associated protein YgaU